MTCIYLSQQDRALSAISCPTNRCSGGTEIIEKIRKLSAAAELNRCAAYISSYGSSESNFSR